MKKGDILILDSQYGEMIRVFMDGKPFISGCGFEEEDLIRIEGNIKDYGIDPEGMTYYDLNEKVELLINKKTNAK